MLFVGGFLHLGQPAPRNQLADDAAHHDSVESKVADREAVTEDKGAEFAASLRKLQVGDRHFQELQSTSVQFFRRRVVFQKKSNDFCDFANEILNILVL